jgi:acetyl/propionyl-CoA carboxylase alpha subunit
LVREQLFIAAGEELPFNQEDIKPRGAAIECRIIAEDADRDFIPCPGTISHLLLPGGPGVRVDSGVYAGWVIPVEYDPLLAKLCTWGVDRDEAIRRMRRALGELRIGGVITTATFLDRVMYHPAFVTGEYDTHLLSEHRDILAPNREHDVTIAAALGAEVVKESGAQSTREGMGEGSSAWKRMGRYSNLFKHV